MPMTKEQRDALRKLKGRGMTSAVGEYTPEELWQLLDQVEELERALTESVKLQSHYATLLNAHDGGQRMTFTVETWLARLEHTGTVRKLKRPIKVANYNPVDDAVLIDAEGKELLGVSEWLRCDDDFLDLIVAAVNAADRLTPALDLLREVRADGIMEDWGSDLPARIDALLKR